MKPIFKAIFRPLSNRHYTNKKTSVLLYSSQFIPSLIATLYGAIFESSIFYLVFLGIIIYGFIDYLLFDAFFDKLSWKFLWSHFYSDEVTSTDTEQIAIKKYEQNPTSESYKDLQKILNKK